MPDEMTAAEYRDGESLVASMQQLIEGHDPAIAACALVSALASLTVTYAEGPIAKARYLASELVATVARPRESRSIRRSLNPAAALSTGPASCLLP
jgi:hypothetical protein